MTTPNFHHQDNQLHCDAVPLTDLAARYGTPLYIYSRRALLDRLALLTNAFADANVDHLICFSVKACPNLAILRLLSEAGAGADVVSEGELIRALAAGVPPERIVFAGVGKQSREIRAALDAGIRSINCESESELRSIEDVARSASKTAPITLRINPGVTAGGHDYIETGHDGTKFGVPASDAPRLYDAIRQSPHLHAIGIGAHIGSQIMEPAPYQRAATVLRKLIDVLRTRGTDLELIDIGGGFGITYDSEAPAPIQQFASAVSDVLRDTEATVVLEPGRFIAGNAGVLLARTVHVKHSGTRTFVVVDAAMNDFMRPSLYGAHHRIEHVSSDTEREALTADVVGPICETGDFLGRDVALGATEQGDLIVVHGAGAYGASMASNYNSRPRAAEVLVDGDEVTLIRRRETYEDLLRTEIGIDEDSQQVTGSETPSSSETPINPGTSPNSEARSNGETAFSSNSATNPLNPATSQPETAEDVPASRRASP